VNGGGQIKSVDPTKGKELIKSVDVAFHSIVPRDPTDNAAVRELYAHWVGDAPGSERARALFHTSYRAVPKSEELNPLAIRW
jgi:iron only hydrogenase large subunit-like protein